MSHHNAVPSGRRFHLARDHVDACRAAVAAVASKMRRPHCSDSLDYALHRSVTMLLQKTVIHLTAHISNSRVLPAYLHRAVADWKETADEHVLERAVQQRSSQWSAAIIELLQRLELDWDDLVREFNLRGDASLVSISAPLGDPHNNGRSVFKLLFDDGRALIYKPRSVDGENVFRNIIAWLQHEGAEPALKSCHVLPRTCYGWTNFVEADYRTDVDAALAYYERQGAFLALFFLISGSDCLGDNVVVAGDHPVWVDVECVCGPSLIAQATSPGVPAWMTDSVLSTAMVFYGNEMGLAPRSITGLSVSSSSDRSLAFDGSDMLRAPYVEAVNVGFHKLYDGLLARRAAWSARSMSWWHEKRVRVVPRSTAFYMCLAEVFQLVPRGMEERAHQMVFETLRNQGRASWDIAMVELELKALERGDVPFWSTRSDSCDLDEAGGGTAKGVAERTGTANVQRRASLMSTADMNNQLWIIDSFLRMRVLPSSDVTY